MADPRMAEILRTIGFGRSKSIGPEYGPTGDLGPLSATSGIIRKYRRMDDPNGRSHQFNFASDEMLEESIREWLRGQGYDEQTIERIVMEEFMVRSPQDVRRPPPEGM